MALIWLQFLCGGRGPSAAEACIIFDCAIVTMLVSNKENEPIQAHSVNSLSLSLSLSLSFSLSLQLFPSADGQFRRIRQKNSATSLMLSTRDNHVTTQIRACRSVSFESRATLAGKARRSRLAGGSYVNHHALLEISKVSAVLEEIFGMKEAHTSNILTFFFHVFLSIDDGL
jgi:hypothetical protein